MSSAETQINTNLTLEQFREQYIRAARAAALKNVSTQAIYEAIRTGRLEAVEMFEQTFVTRESLDRYSPIANPEKRPEQRGTRRGSRDVTKAARGANGRFVRTA